MNYIIILHPAEEGGYWTEVPSLPGCGSQGDSLEQAIEMTRDATSGYLESLKQDGEEIPAEQNIVMTLTVAA